MAEITQDDMNVAKNIAKRWRKDATFSSDDAFQEMMLSLLESNIPNTSPRLRGKAMKDSVVTASIENSYLMRIPETTWRKNKSAPLQAKYTGLSTDVVGPQGVPEAYLEDPDRPYDQVVDRVAVQEALSTLGEWDRDRLIRWSKNPNSFAGGAFYAVKKTLARLHEEHADK